MILASSFCTQGTGSKFFPARQLRDHKFFRIVTKPYAPSRPTQCQSSAEANRSTPAAPLSPSLEQAVALLVTAKEEIADGSSIVTEQTLTSIISLIEEMAASSGLDHISLDFNQGEFQGTTLTGPMAARLSGPLPLGMLSFGAYHPADLLVERLTASELAETGHRVADVFKGPAYGHEQAYVISTPFKFQLAVPGAGTGSVRGVSRAIGTYTLAAPHDEETHSKRLDISFHTMLLEPLLSGRKNQDSGDSKVEELAAWKSALLPHNPEMDPETGVLEVKLPKAMPGWQDYFMMAYEYQLLQGNAGSKTLLTRME